MFIATISGTDEQVARKRTLGAAIDAAMEISQRRGCAKVDVRAHQDPIMGDAHMITVAFAGRGVLLSADVDTRDPHAVPVVVEVEAEAGV